ncbi:MAG: hypothetical protein PHW73_02305 [Atribacterota bacterium]|nr:hypothetical protein [Atribacterota bacterium]
MTDTQTAKNWEILDQLSKNHKETGLVSLKANDGKVYLVRGAIGDQARCACFVEHFVKDPMWQTKYYGISYLFKGITENEIIDKVTITKRALAETLRKFPFIALFKKRLIDLFYLIYTCDGGVKSVCLKDEEFCPTCQEIIRAGHKVFREEKMIDLVYFIAMALQFSPSYRVRVQDWAEIINKDRFKKHPLLELLRVRKVMKEREGEIGTKIFHNAFIGAYLVAPRLTREFINELDTDKMGFDEADWYFVLRRKTYNYRGIPYAQRLEEAQKIDKEKEHLILGL